ncbi:alpha/beta hydrolase family protein [Deinococcus sp. PESE-13]
MNSFDLPLLLGLLLSLILGRRCGRWPVVLLALGLLLHLAFGVARWQLLPAYFAAALVFVLGLRSPIKRRRGRVGWGLLTALLSLSALGLSWALPLFRLPVPSGPQHIGTQVLRGQSGVTVQVWYPTPQASGRKAPYLFDAPVAAALARSVGLPGFAFGHLRRLPTHASLNAPPASGRHPTLLFFHGLGGVRQQNTFQAENLASHGYLVVGIDMPGYAAATVNGRGQVISNTHGSANLSNRLSDRWVQEWAQTGRGVLDELLADPQWRARIDPQRLGAFGHSFGGATASYLLLTDPRIGAALNMDAGIFGRPLPEQGYSRPFFMMNTRSGLDLERLRTQASRLTDQQVREATQGQTTTQSAYLQDLSELFRRRRQALQGRAWSLVLPGTQHLSFSDVTLYSPLLAGGEDVTATHREINAFTLAFFDLALRGQAVSPSALRQHFPASDFRVGQAP